MHILDSEEYISFLDILMDLVIPKFIQINFRYTLELALQVKNRFYAYSVVARLALLAAAIELEEHDPEAI